MALGLYDAPFGNKFSEGGLQTFPITTTHRGDESEAIDLLLYLRNDDPLQWFSDIVVTPVDFSAPDDTLGDKGTGWGIKLSPGIEQPSVTKWASIKFGESIEMSDIGDTGSPDTTTFYPFWFRIVSPSGEDVQTKIDIKLQIDLTKNAV